MMDKVVATQIIRIAKLFDDHLLSQVACLLKGRVYVL